MESGETADVEVQDCKCGHEKSMHQTESYSGSMCQAMTPFGPCLCQGWRPA